MMKTIKELFNNNDEEFSTSRKLLSTKLNGIWANKKTLYADYPCLPENEVHLLEGETLGYFSLTENILKELEIPTGKLLSIQQINNTWEGEEYPEALYIFTFGGLTAEQAKNVAKDLDWVLANDDYGFDSFTCSQSQKGITTIIGKINC